MASIVQRIATGTPGLDKMLKGGLLPGSVYSLVGPPGSGKTILATQFLLEGVKRGENTLFVSLDEAPCQIRENLGTMFGVNFDKILVLDGTLEMRKYERTPLRDVSIVRHAEAFGKVFPEIPCSADLHNPEITITAIQEMIKVEVRDHKVTRIVIDSISAILCFMTPSGERNVFLQSFLRFLSDLDATTIVTIQESDSPVLEMTSIEYVMSRGVVRMHRWLQNNDFKLGISVDKFRGSEHDESIKRVKITPIGLQVLEKQSNVERGM
jgi:KaiC/GvpD/RAD55 family RecA-like ATPase